MSKQFNRFYLYIFIFILTSISFSVFAEPRQHCSLGETCKVSSSNIEFDFLPSAGKSFSCHIWNGAYWLFTIRFWGEKDFYFPMITSDLDAHEDAEWNIDGRYFENPKQGRIVVDLDGGTAKLIKCEVRP